MPQGSTQRYRDRPEPMRAVGASTVHTVLVRSARLDDLSTVLTRVGASVLPGIDDSIIVSGLDSHAIGELAAAYGLTLHELATQHTTVEDASMEPAHSDDHRSSTTV